MGEEDSIKRSQKIISLAESSVLSISKLISKALNDGRISDTEFNLILREVEQYHSLKKGLRSGGTGFDVKAIKEEIKKRMPKKAWINCRHKEINIQFEKRPGGFSLFIRSDKFTD